MGASLSSLVAHAIAEGDGWRAARALVAFRALFGSRSFQRGLRWRELEGQRVDRERALRVARGVVKAVPRGGAERRAA